MTTGEPTDGPPPDAPGGERAGPPNAPPTSTYRPNYFQTRFSHSRERLPVWRHICRYLERWISPSDDVLELGAGRCEFANSVVAASVTAMDIDSVVTREAQPGVRAEVGDCSDLSRFPDRSFDDVVASNLLEHLERPNAERLLAEAFRVLRPAGLLLLIQPNFRLNPHEYFDDYTHVAIYTDRSIRDLLSAAGWQIVFVRARFLPLTMKSRTSRLTFLVPLYLRSPLRPFAGQMLVVASRPVG